MSKLKYSLLLIVFFFVANSTFSQYVSVPFKDGFIGSIGSNTQQANNITNFTTLGISKSAFFQQTSNGNFYYTQGNDIGGKLRLYFSSPKSVTISGVTTTKNYIDIDGAIVWRETITGSVIYFGFIPNPNTNVTFNYSTSSTYSITRSSDGNTGSNIGNLRVDESQTFTNNTNLSGNAAGVLIDLESYKVTVQNFDPIGPVTVNALTTTNQTPTLTGTATLRTGESLTVTVNGFVYSVGGGNLTISGNNWTLVIPNSLSIATYSVDAIITNADAYTLTDLTVNELVIQIPPPAGLTYTSPNVYTVGTAIGTLTPTSTGGAIASYSVSPSLPAGLTINTTTGVITGTPSAVSTQTSYVVTGTNASGTVTATVVMTVNPTPPLTLSYTSPNVYTVGTAIGTLTPTSTGGAIASYSVSPSLPAGLTINTTTGVITGIPSAVSTQTSYVVTGTNASGTVTATVVMTVNIAPPAGLTYTSPNVYIVGIDIGTLTPTSTGGAIASYSVSPSLPAGLTINTTTGVITGTPSAVSSQTSYVVTGTNASGTVTATVILTVENPPPPPAGLTYTSPNVYTVGTAIGTLTPTSTGGAIASYSVSPSLPAGLTINTTTGVITGTPSAVSTQTSYVVTGTNASGTVTATVVMTVNIAPPAGLTYTSPNVYTVGTAIGTLTPTSTGGAIASYSVSPSLPAGLTINTTTGVITGIPSAVSTQTSYVVTGTNASGTVTATVVMTVNIAPPAGLTYTSPNVYTVGTAIGTLTPTSTGGAIASYSVSPSLPAGLTINTTTGVITGTPSAVSSQTSYVVTGTNASGTVTATVVMTVNIAPPAGLTYTSPNVYTVGTAIGTLTPTSTGGAIASYSVSPSLPAGLTINTTTGVITGTPSAVSSQTSYVVTGTNASGTVTATVVMTVNIAPPAGLTYTSPNVYTVGTAIGTLTPTSTGGAIASYSVSPSLPAGLTINTTTGVITGTPSAVSTQTSYVVTGTNASGTVTATVVMTVNIAPPAGLTYTSPNVYTVGTAIGTLTPTSTGGAIASYSVSPSLPAGLTINTTTGVITGTPSAVSTQTSYVVTGTNASGTVTATVVMTVNIAPPAGLTYTSPNVYTVGTAIGTLTPTSTGGAIASYSVSPSLPAGLTINTTTGVITGTPSAVSTQTSYVVTGTNASGTVTATVVMTVNIAPPAGLTYTSPNVYTVGTAIGTLTPTSTGGAIASYSVSPSLPAGLTINTTTGVITGTPSAVSTQTSYVVTGTNASGTVTATVVMTVNSNTIPQPQQPQGALNAVDFKLLANDTVKLKLSVSNGTSPFTLILNNSYNTLKDTIKNLVPINSDVIFKLKQLDTTKIYTIFKLIDANDNVRSSGFTKDTTKVNVLKPKIVLNLKADPTVKQNDNSFKTKLFLKIKNVGDIDLKNVQVNANISNALPQGIEYKLDSVRVLTGNLSINPNYNGAGSATAVSRVQNYITVLNSESKNTYSVLDQNFLFNNGISLNKNEEGEVVYFVSIGATTKNISIKLQFETAAAGILTKSDGTSSSQVTKSKSDDGTNINEHPDLTNDGVPLPTYVPLIPNEKIGASLSVSASKLVAGGYEFHFIAKVKNFGNINLDSIRIEYDLTKLFPIPDQAVLVSNPIIKRGNIVYNASNYNGNTNIDLFKYGGDLQVGDSALYEYDLKVITNKTSYTWPNYFIVFGRSINSGLVIHDTSMAGLNPDPNNDNDPIEKFFTSVTINYKAPSPPVVENKTYVFGSNIPANIGGLVKSTPTGTIPVWCNEKTAACLIIPPATPTQIGRYIFTLRSYDTTTLLYSEVFVYDTIIIKPPIPDVVNKKYVINNTNNPLNISSQVTGMAGSVINYYKNSILQSVVPILGSLPGTTRYTSSQIVNTIESDTVGFTITMLEPAALLHLQKLADEPKLQSNSTFNITYTFIVTNKTTEAMTNVLLEDNLQNTFPAPITFDVVSITSSGGLVFNNAFNGKTDIQLLKATSILAASAIDTLRLVVNLQPKGYNGTVNNLAIVTASSSYGPLNINSSTKANNEVTAKLPTPSVIPNLVIDIPEAFSPNRDGVNDRFVILKPFGTTLELEIFNRWGNVVYYNSNYNNDWDGRGTNNFIGQDLVDGGYYYTLKAKSANGNSQIFKGFVLIQR